MELSALRKVALSCAALLTLGSTACYTYAPVRQDVMVPRQRVRMTVTPERALALEPALAGPRRTFTATYIAQEAGSMVVEVQLRSETAGMSTRGVANRLSVPLADVVAVEESSFSLVRTAAAIGLGVAAVAAVGVAVFGGDDGGTLEEPPPVDNSVIFSIPIG